MGGPFRQETSLPGFTEWCRGIEPSAAWAEDVAAETLNNDESTQRKRVADIFISYTSSDRDWAFWIAKELEALGHTPHVHEWEIKGGDDIYAWMEARHDTADHVLCVVSDEYLKASKFYSQLERRAAL